MSDIRQSSSVELQGHGKTSRHLVNDKQNEEQHISLINWYRGAGAEKTKTFQEAGFDRESFKMAWKVFR